MKLAYTIATPEVERMPFAWVGDLDRALARLKAIGYHGVELQVRNPLEFDQESFARKCAAAGLTICAVSTGGIGETEGFFFTSPEPEKRRAAIERYKSVIALAARYQCDSSIGRLRGQVKWAPSRDRGIGWVREALEELLPISARHGLRIVLEPQHAYNLDFLNTFAETIAFIRSFHHDNLAFEADVHHVGLTERSIPAALVSAVNSGLLTLVQVSDSNRLPPGMGGFNWMDVFETLKAAGYDGWISVECKQYPDSERSAEHSFRFIDALVHPPAA